MSVMQGGGVFSHDVSRHLCTRVCSCVRMLLWRNEERERGKPRTPNCDHTTTITTSTTTIQILQGLFCVCVRRLSATFVRHGIVSISVFWSWEIQITSFIFKTNGGYFFQLTQKALTKGEGSSEKKKVYTLVSKTVCSELVAKLYKEIKEKKKAHTQIHKLFFKPKHIWMIMDPCVALKEKKKKHMYLSHCLHELLQFYRPQSRLGQSERWLCVFICFVFLRCFIHRGCCQITLKRHDVGWVEVGGGGWTLHIHRRGGVYVV